LLDETTYFNKTKIDNFDNIFDKGTTFKFSQLLKSEGIILFSDSDNNIWEIVRRKDLKPEDLIDNLHTIYSITNYLNYYVEGDYNDYVVNNPIDDQDIGISVEMNLSKYTDVAYSHRFQETVNEISEIII
jgi:hypothetical protein